MEHRLIIAEKNNAAVRLALILSDGTMRRARIGPVPIYQFEGPEFLAKDQPDQQEGRVGTGRRMAITVIGLRGHIMALDYPDRFNVWKDVDPRSLIDEPPIKKAEATAIVAALQELAPSLDEVVVATDFDREGELIGLEAVEVIHGAHGGIPVRRTRFSSLTRGEILEAFCKERIVDLDHNLALSAETRQRVDLVWGATLTRYISLTSEQLGADFLSVGRVQSPTLALIVDREREIRAFVPVPYWEVNGTFGTHADPPRTNEQVTFPGLHRSGRFPEEAPATAVVRTTSGAPTGTVVSVSREERKDFPPSPFNTTAFLAAITAMGMSAARAMAIAENLYTSGYISYPRTDNTVYPRTLSLRTILESLRATPFASEVEQILAQDQLRPSRGKRQTTDHPPIHPSAAADPKKLGKEPWKVYELVVRRFLATLAPAGLVRATKLTVSVEGEPFDVEGKELLAEGWRAYYPYFPFHAAPVPTHLQEGDAVTVLAVQVDRKETEPPRRYGQGSLIQEMERLELGTKATRHEILQKLYQRNFVSNRIPEPTTMGFALIETLEHHAPLIAAPQMTATLEEDMEAIAEGRKTPNEVLEESRTMLHQVFDQLQEHTEGIAAELKAALKEKEQLGECPKCHQGQLLVRRSRRGKRFASCSRYPECDQSYPLPQRGKLALEDVGCALCAAPKVKVITAGRPPWLTCVNFRCEVPECPERPPPKAPKEPKVKKAKSKRKSAARKKGARKKEPVTEEPAAGPTGPGGPVPAAPKRPRSRARAPAPSPTSPPSTPPGVGDPAHS